MNGVFSRLWLVGKTGNSDDGEAEVDNAILELQNSSYPTKVEFNNCFIIHSEYFPVLKGVSALQRAKLLSSLVQ